MLECLSYSSLLANPKQLREQISLIPLHLFSDFIGVLNALSSQEVFNRVDNMSAVVKQPTCKEERLNALQVLFLSI